MREDLSFRSEMVFLGDLNDGNNIICAKLIEAEYELHTCTIPLYE